jgi:hypothetical protein
MDFSLQNAQGQAISGAQVNVYTQSACGATAGALATLYPTASGGTPLAQPLITDGFGHQFAYALPGCVTITYNSPYTGILTYTDQSVFSGGSSGYISAVQSLPQTMIGPLSVTTPGIFTNIVSHCANEGFVNGANLSMFASSGYANFTQDGACGAVIAPVGATVSQSNGVSGMVDNYANGVTVTNSPAAMGGYFQARQYGSGGTAAWGVNALGIIESGVADTTLSNEVDFDVNSDVTGAIVMGWQINFPYFDSLPSSSLGVSVGTPGCRTPDYATYPATGCPQLQYGYVTQAGASPISYLSSPLYSAAQSLALGGSPSQSMQLLSLSAANAPKASYISSDVQGNLDLIPYAGQVVSVPALNATSLNSSGPVSAATSLNGNGGIINETDGTTGLISLRSALTHNYIESANPASTTDVPLAIAGHNGTGSIPALTIIATTTAISGGLGIGGGTVMTANHGTGTSVQHSDGTGTSTHPAVYSSNGSLTDGPAGYTGSCAPTTTLTVVDGIITGCS